jgi:hypothetical protein
MNESHGIKPFRIYGLLTDGTYFEFFGFNPTSGTFYRDKKLNLSAYTDRDATWTTYVNAMAPGMSFTWSLFLS